METPLNLDFSFSDEPSLFRFNKTTTNKIDDLKLDLSNTLNEFCVAFNEYISAESKISRYIRHSSSRLNAMNSMEEVINKWIDGQCDKASDNADNIGHLTITRDRLPSDIGTFSFPRRGRLCGPDPVINTRNGKGKAIFEASIEELSQFALSTLDFAELHHALMKEVSEIEDAGFKDASIKLANMFGFIKRHTSTPLQVKSQKGRYILEFAHYGSWTHDRIRSLQSKQVLARTFEMETGVTGFNECLKLLIAEEELIASHDAYVPSRTVVNAEGDVKAVFFNGKIKFHFKPSIFEALVSFIKSYSSESICTIEVK